ncbi:MAG: 2Fe-2S iron-sulfur cluster binding domain-containing protein [Clostridiales bacterium]|nr:2Fe-2S iron-sulfur cluster binding domain-containing protein [Clostridiales bacterium]
MSEVKMINLKIDGTPVTVPEGTTILDAARQASIDIPTLCYLKEINEIGACRMCVVEIKGSPKLNAACVYPVAEGMEVITNSKRVFEARRINLELLLSNHRRECLSCVRSGNCELQKLCRDYGVEDERRFDGAMTPSTIDDSATHMIRDNSKCILCRRCTAVCDQNQAAAVIGVNNRGFNTHIGCAFDAPLNTVACVSCGQCIVACPTGALFERDDTDRVWEALRDPEKRVVVQTAPSIRATLGESFGMSIGTNVEGKMVAALRRLGFDDVFDTDFSADLTIVEEANELVERIKTGGKLPLITSCSPGWINYCEHYFPDFIENLSTCKSPQQMFGAVTKSWYAEKLGIDPKNIFMVSIMPCTAKKYECKRPEQAANGIPDIDVALTTRELARMIERAGIDFTALPDEKFDDPLGVSTGAAVIFGATGGVMEAALRTAAEWITGDTAAPVEFTDVRGTEDIKEATYKVGDLTLNVAVTSGLKNAEKLLESVISGEKNYHFIEVMACPGGCVNGGGQPIQPAKVRNNVDLKKLRAKALYSQDSSMPLRKSHDNPVIKEVYDKYLEKPGSHRAHELLHTSYVAKDKFTGE